MLQNMITAAYCLKRVKGNSACSYCRHKKSQAGVSSKEQSEPACTKMNLAGKECGMLQVMAPVISDLDKNSERNHHV